MYKTKHKTQVLSTRPFLFLVYNANLNPSERSRQSVSINLLSHTKKSCENQYQFVDTSVKYSLMLPGYS